MTDMIILQVTGFYVVKFFIQIKNIYLIKNKTIIYTNNKITYKYLHYKNLDNKTCVRSGYSVGPAFQESTDFTKSKIDKKIEYKEGQLTKYKAKRKLLEIYSSVFYNNAGQTRNDSNNVKFWKSYDKYRLPNVYNNKF